MFQKIIPSSDSKHKQEIIRLRQNDINISKKYCESAQKMLMWWTPTYVPSRTVYKFAGAFWAIEIK